MKKLLVLLVCLFVNYGFSQNPNFKIEDNLIKWQYVYNDSLNIDNLKSNLNLEFITDFSGNVKRSNFNDEKLNDQTSEFIIEKKENKYRVTIYNIKIIPTQMAFSMNGVTSMPKDIIRIEEILLKNNKIKKTFWGVNLSEILHPHYFDLFVMKQKIKEDW